jgi:DNA anti-recombination protein RmuC
MNPTKLSALAISLAVFATACDKRDSIPQRMDTTSDKSSQSAQEMKDYTYAQRAEFAAAMQSQRDAINRDLEALEAKIEKASDSVKAEAKPRLQALRDQSAKLGTKLEGLKDATESTWDSVKAGSKVAYAEMKEGFNQARQWVSEKIAP